LSDAELIRRAIERGAKIDQPPSDTELLQRASRPRPPIDCGPEVKPEPKPSVERRRIPRPRGTVTVGRIERHLEAGRLTGLSTTLPDEPVNLEAHFYVDVKGVPADLVGLLQGLCDALQAATVVRDDNWIRGFDGSRISYLDKNHPRTELELCPLKDFEKKS
jgi:hypothetical protein